MHSPGAPEYKELITHEFPGVTLGDVRHVGARTHNFLGPVFFCALARDRAGRYLA